MSDKDLQSRIKAAKQRLESLTSELKSIKQSRSATSIVATASLKNKAPSNIREITCKRTFKAHGGEVTSVYWSGMENILVSCGKDAQVIIWDAFAKKRMQTISHKTQWLMACAFERTSNKLVAAGGADKVCSIFMAGQIGMVRPSAELAGHDGYVSSCVFIDENNILTSSGDSRVIHWDISQARAKVTYTEHAADCMSVCLSPQQNIFATGSADCTAKIWDTRSGTCSHTFHGHESDINAVEFFPDGYSIATASSDATCRIFDIRSYGQVCSFDSIDSSAGASSVGLSSSGRMLFAGFEDGNCRAWDILSPNSAPFTTLHEHADKVTSLSLNCTGTAICTGSIDTTIKVMLCAYKTSRMLIECRFGRENNDEPDFVFVACTCDCSRGNILTI